MKIVYLNRIETSNQGTFGIWSCPELNFSCYTLEPPWRDNAPNFSCIPPGEYTVEIRHSPKYGRIYHVKGVEGRSYILIHSGNFAGNRFIGLKTHSLGCILLGLRRGILQGQRAVLMSRIALKRFMETMNFETFKLIIR